MMTLAKSLLSGSDEFEKMAANSMTGGRCGVQRNLSPHHEFGPARRSHWIAGEKRNQYDEQKPDGN
jgi:hypothetical protein